MNSENLENYISQAEAARVIGTTTQTVSHLARGGHFTTKVVAGRVLVLRSEVEKYVARPKGRPPKKEVAQKLPSKKIHKRDSKKYFSQAEAARRRGVSKQAIAALIQRGRLTPVEVGGRIEYLITLSGSNPPVRIRCLGKVLRSQKQDGGEAPFEVAVTMERYQFMSSVETASFAAAS